MSEELDESGSNRADQLRQTASYLRGARALLGLNVKSVARALRYSDKTLKDIERSADGRNRKVKALAQFYEDLGLKFAWVGLSIEGVDWTREVRPLVLCFKDYDDAAATADDFCGKMRYIGGFAYNLKLTDKTKASPYDTVEAHFPVVTRHMARELLGSWLGEKAHDKGLQLLPNDGGDAVPVTKDNFQNLLL